MSDPDTGSGPSADRRRKPVVRVVGTGLLGTSVGLGLSAAGHRVLLADPSPTALALARDLGAGEADRGDAPPDLVLVAAPPDVTAQVLVAELARHPQATVTDVASIKDGLREAVEAAGGDPDRYVGGHPMAGAERSGPVAARGDLFLGRPWVVCPGPRTPQWRVEQVSAVAGRLGATPVRMGPAEHDAAVALVSHVPQLAASLVAARLQHAPDAAVALAGQGLRDVTRIAGSDPLLWAQILSANAAPVLTVLRELSQDLAAVTDALEQLAAAGGGDAPGARAGLAGVVAGGNAGRDRIPGKHGQPPTRYDVVDVLLPDAPGQLGRLFADIGAAGINVEEFALEHASGALVGRAGVSVLPAAGQALREALTERGWRVVD